jgi:hypothetical protein
MEGLSNIIIKSLINANQVAIQTMGIQIVQLQERNESLKELIISINERHMRDLSDQWEYYSELRLKLETIENKKKDT